MLDIETLLYQLIKSGSIDSSKFKCWKGKKPVAAILKKKES